MPSTYDAQDWFSKEILEPTVLVLSGKSVVAESVAWKPLYQMDRRVTSIPQKNSSVVFERVEYRGPANSKATEVQNRHLFYLAHPIDAQYRKDIPGYYITSVAPDMLGNICFQTSKAKFQKTEFEALLSAGKSFLDSPLFDNREVQLCLFNVKRKWNESRYKWTDSDGRQIAAEDGKGDERRLVVKASMQRNMRDALVAMWILKLWHDTAESKEAKREAIESLMPQQVYQSDMKLSKRVGALAGAAAGGGG